MPNRIAIDMGGTKTEIMLTENDPFKIIERKRVPTNREKGYSYILENLANLILAYRNKCQTAPLIGMGIPGTISPKTGLVRNANTTCLIGKPLKTDLEKRIGLPVYIENDANCFALSEALYGAGKGYENVMGIIMGTGMGGGLILSGKLWGGRQGIAGEFGHSSINFNGLKCWCGQKGCLEMYLSGPAIEENYKNISGQKLSVEEIYGRYTSQESAAETAMNDLLDHFSRGMANLIACFDPDIIVIGGGVSNLPILYTEGVRRTSQRIFSDSMDTPIVKNQLGDSSGIFGAALLADN